MTDLLQLNGKYDHVTEWCPTAVVTLWNLLLKYPIAVLYLYGPAWLGGWNGQNMTDICAQLTGVKSDFWLRHPDTCQELLERQFESYYLTMCVGAYFLLVFVIVVRLLRRLF